MYQKIEYKIVSASDHDEMAQMVNGLLGDGWELCGGVSCALSGTDDTRYAMFAQAMTRLLSPAEQVEIVQKKQAKAK